ncbi:unnamed protein product [Oncorhynchus mykiss]|uniref:Uncharacterized protein n=1 Tax=Oncorhynchus mykiss TaxID=8022 RepID=A0A060WVY4_ONCMY|nr:unnamed protein product [Oncorhynchus mykiss]
MLWSCFPRPCCLSYHMRSLACLTSLGRYSDCLRLFSNWLQVDSETADLLTLRARLHKQLNQGYSVPQAERLHFCH